MDRGYWRTPMARAYQMVAGNAIAAVQNRATFSLSSEADLAPPRIVAVRDANALHCDIHSCGNQPTACRGADTVRMAIHDASAFSYTRIVSHRHTHTECERVSYASKNEQIRFISRETLNWCTHIYPLSDS